MTVQHYCPGVPIMVAASLITVGVSMPDAGGVPEPGLSEAVEPAIEMEVVEQEMEEIETEEEVPELSDLPPHTFLAVVRRAFEEKVWGEFSGQVQHISPRARISTDIKVAVRIEAPQFMRSRIVLHRDTVYDVTRLMENNEVRLNIRQPDEEERVVSLDELGMRSEDLLFVFLYWDLIEELPPETVRGRPCRVLKLEEPRHRRRVIAWFSAEHLAPLRIVWLKEDGETPERTLEMTEFQSRRGVWYVVSFRLTGDDWQTRVRFFDGSLRSHEHRAPPRRLFPD